MLSDFLSALQAGNAGVQQENSYQGQNAALQRSAAANYDQSDQYAQQAADVQTPQGRKFTPLEAILGAVGGIADKTGGFASTFLPAVSKGIDNDAQFAKQLADRQRESLGMKAEIANRKATRDLSLLQNRQGQYQTRAKMIADARDSDADRASREKIAGMQVEGRKVVADDNNQTRKTITQMNLESKAAARAIASGDKTMAAAVKLAATGVPENIKHAYEAMRTAKPDIFGKMTDEDIQAAMTSLSPAQKLQLAKTASESQLLKYKVADYTSKGKLRQAQASMIQKATAQMDDKMALQVADAVVSANLADSLIGQRVDSTTMKAWSEAQANIRNALPLLSTQRNTLVANQAQAIKRRDTATDADEKAAINQEITDYQDSINSLDRQASQLKKSQKAAAPSRAGGIGLSGAIAPLAARHGLTIPEGSPAASGMKQDGLPPIATARRKAAEKIKAGYDPMWIRTHFRKLYGQDL